jgi:DNA segregation ATPase FtsK/SpoIIIE, S-DNA-T family
MPLWDRVNCHLFNYRVCLRVDSPDQVGMLLGEDARDRGALCDTISAVPELGAGVAWVRDEGSPEVVKVRSAYVTDGQIREMTQQL